MNVIFPFKESFLDYPNNIDSAIVMYIMGCEHNCFKCSNPNFQDINYEDFNTVKLSVNSIIDYIKIYSKKRF